jgi:hypothetical protein
MRMMPPRESTIPRLAMLLHSFPAHAGLPHAGDLPNTIRSKSDASLTRGATNHEMRMFTHD